MRQPQACLWAVSFFDRQNRMSKKQRRSRCGIANTVEDRESEAERSVILIERPTYEQEAVAEQARDCEYG